MSWCACTDCSQMGLGSEGVPGYISMGGAASEWSDGFRTVRSLKYSGSSDGFSELYRKIVVVGGIQDKQHHWPQELRSFMQVGTPRVSCFPAEDLTLWHTYPGAWAFAVLKQLRAAVTRILQA